MMPRRKGLFEYVVEAPMNMMERGVDLVFGSTEPNRPKRRKPEAQRCPVCDGTGFQGDVRCRSCDGKGYVVV
jgi:hypothetical protein